MRDKLTLYTDGLDTDVGALRPPRVCSLPHRMGHQDGQVLATWSAFPTTREGHRCMEALSLSDSAQIVVNIEVSAEQALILANVVRAWLVGEQIIEREQSNTVLSATGHRPGTNYRDAIETDDGDFLRGAVNGVRIAVGRREAVVFVGMARTGSVRKLEKLRSIFGVNADSLPVGGASA